jgi:signal transduction histidine kinase
LTENNDHLQVEIRDNGVGITATDQLKLFRIDSNFSNKGTNGEEGTGLGLIICKEFIEKNNGRIWVESKPREGSSFFFTVPILS